MKITRFTLLLASFTLLGISACAAASETTEFTVVSFNIRNGGRRMDGVYDRSMQQRVVAALKPDLFAMQEVDRKTTRVGGADVPAEFADALGLKFHYASAMKFAGGEYGTAAFSKFPIVSSKTIPMPFKGVEPRASSLMMVTLPTGDGLAFVSVHLSSEEAEARADNIRLLLSRLEKVTTAVIVAGDFNAGTESESVMLLEKAGFRLCVPKGNAQSYPADKPVEAIDHVLIRDGAATRLEDAGTEVVNEPVASDHRPLVSHLRLVSKKQWRVNPAKFPFENKRDRQASTLK
jgi:endonuclease/exonuclease/phosphatase family metal-dependent hydrolase